MDVAKLEEQILNLLESTGMSKEELMAKDEEDNDDDDNYEPAYDMPSLSSSSSSSSTLDPKYDIDINDEDDDNVCNDDSNYSSNIPSPLQLNGRRSSVKPAIV